MVDTTHEKEIEAEVVEEEEVEEEGGVEMNGTNWW